MREEEEKKAPVDLVPLTAAMRSHVAVLRSAGAIRCTPGEWRARRGRAVAGISKPPPDPGLVDRVVAASAMKLSDYQVHGLRRFDAAAHGLAACYATGMGKTLLAAACAARLAHQVPGLLVIYVAPKSLQGNLGTALERYIGESKQIRVNRMDGKDARPSLIEGTINLKTYTYEGFHTAWVRDIGLAHGALLVLDEAHHARTDVGSTLRANLKDIAEGRRGKRKARRIDAPAAAAAADEHDLAHVPDELRPLFKVALAALRSAARQEHLDPVSYLWDSFGIYAPPHAPRSLACVHSARLAMATLCLTATPFYDNPEDGANIVAMVRGLEPFGRGYFARLVGVSKAKRAAPLDAEFARGIRGCFVFKDPDPASDPSLPRTRPLEVLEVPMTEAYQALYEQVEAEAESSPYEKPWAFYGGVRRAANNVESHLAFGEGAHVEAGVGLDLKDGAVVNPKCAVVVDLVLGELERRVFAVADRDQTAPCGKVIVHSTFISCGVRIIQAHLRRLGVPYAEITGQHDQPARDAAIRGFNASHAPGAAEPRTRVLFITDAGSEGIDPRGQTMVVKYEPGWNPSARAQAFGRGSRRGALDHLRPEDREVRLVQLVLVKTGNGGRGSSGTRSADHMLYYDFTLRKEREIDAVMARVRAAQ